MLVRVTRDRVPYVGRRGERREIGARQARILALLGLVDIVRDKPQVPSAPEYGRRDMRAVEGKSSRKRRQRTAD